MNVLPSLFSLLSSEGVVSNLAATDVRVSRSPTCKKPKQSYNSYIHVFNFKISWGVNINTFFFFSSSFNRRMGKRLSTPMYNIALMRRVLPPCSLNITPSSSSEILRATQILNFTAQRGNAKLKRVTRSDSSILHLALLRRVILQAHRVAHCGRRGCALVPSLETLLLSLSF